MKPVNLDNLVKSGVVDSGMSFSQKVWAVVARVPRGRVTTYALVARALGTRGYRAVGQALNRNPHSTEVPCHRVVGSDRRLTGFAGGLGKKRSMLRKEGVRMKGDRVSPDFLWTPPPVES
jgi:methylated-DNA-[protein]-cysteine S-methyltransferase